MTVQDAFRMDGLNALVTGASSNIGFEIARAYSESGASVLMVARGREALEARAEQIRQQTSAQIHTFNADVADPTQAAALLAHAHEVFDQVDTLVNCAHASASGTPVLELTEDEWQLCHDVNVVAPWRLVKGVAGAMNSGRGGSVINVLSGSGFLPVRGNAAYGATKSALWLLTRYLATECAPMIRANAIVPGIILPEDQAAAYEITPEALAALPPAQRIPREEVFQQIAMGRLGYPTEIAPAAVYLASPAASYTTGALLFVNGGRPW